MNLIRDYWIELVMQLIKEKASFYRSSRKFVQHLDWKIPGSIWQQDDMGFNLVDLSYSPNGTKMTQLERNYFNQGSIDRARKKLDRRMYEEEKPQTSVGISTISEGKKKSSQGHCIRGLVLSHINLDPEEERFTIDIFYRSTEVVQKWGADLIFLHDKLIPAILEGFDVSIEEIAFHFSNIYLSTLFFSILYQYRNPVELLKFTDKHDNKLYKRFFSRADKLIYKDPEDYSFQYRVKMQQLWLDHVAEGKVNEDELKFYLQEVRDANL